MYDTLPVFINSNYPAHLKGTHFSFLKDIHIGAVECQGKVRAELVVSRERTKIFLTLTVLATG